MYNRLQKMANLDDILKNALRLEVSERAALAQKLLASLDELSEAETERLWAEEAQRRLDGYRAGHAKVTPAEDVAKKAGKLFR